MAFHRFNSTTLYCEWFLFLSERIKQLTEELENERNSKRVSSMDNDSARVALQKQAAKNSGWFMLVFCSKLSDSKSSS